MFPGVYMGETRAEPGLRLEGTVEEIYEDDAGNGRQAVLSITVTLLEDDARQAGDQLWWQQNYNAREPYRDRSPASLAAAMSRAMARISGALIEDIRRVLAAGKPTPIPRQDEDGTPAP